ncbi:glycosyltransferase family 24 protein [Lactarius tabidus]
MTSVLARAGLVLSLLTSTALSGTPPPSRSPCAPAGLPTILLEIMCNLFPLLDVLTCPDALPAKDMLSSEAQQHYLSKLGTLEAIVAFYKHYSDNAQRMRNDEPRDADAVMNAASCSSWVDWYGEICSPAERPIPPDVVGEKRYLSGYGVALDLKKMDYSLSTIDARKVEVRPTSEDDQAVYANNAEADLDSVLQLLVLIDLFLVADSPTPPQTLKKLAHDFPRYATSLARHVVSQSGLLEDNCFEICQNTLCRKDLMFSLTSLGLLPGEAFELVTHPSFGTSSQSGGATENVFDASDRAEGGSLSFWWSDIEKDSQAPTIRRNLFNVMVVLDLSRPESLHFTANTVSMPIDRSYSTHIGFVPITTRVSYHLTQNYSHLATIKFFCSVLYLQGEKEDLDLDWSNVLAQFEALVSSEEIQEGSKAISFDTLTSGSSEVFEERISKARAYSRRLGTDNASSPNGHLFINGKYCAIDGNFSISLKADVGQALQYFQERAYKGEITDDQKWSRRILPLGNGVPIINLPDLHKQAGLYVSPASFIYPAFEQLPLSIYVVPDFDTEEGLTFLRDAVTFADTASACTHFTFYHNPVSPNSDPGRQTHVSSLFSHLIRKDLLSRATASQLLQVLRLRSESGSKQYGQRVLSMSSPLDEIIGRMALADIDQNDYQRRDCELEKRVQPVVSAVEDIVPLSRATTGEPDSAATAADVVSMVSSVVSMPQVEDPTRSGIFNKDPVARSQDYARMDDQYTAFTVSDNTTALHRFVVIFDPLSDQAQIFTSLFEWLLNIPTVCVELLLLLPECSELPSKRFYRYNLIPSLTFDGTGHEIPAQELFCDLPIELIYALCLDKLLLWLVRPREAFYILDNIQLGVLSGDEQQHGVEAVFELDYIIIGGHSRERGTNSPPCGLQLQLAAHHGMPIDTLIVENLGYLQLKAAPSVYHLEIYEKCGREVFAVEGAGNEGWIVMVTSFEGLMLFPRLERLPGQEFADDYSGNPRRKSWSPSEFISSVFKPSEGKGEAGEINIFTVASGLLFASIMILSVLRNTMHTMKFWFIENFLSPSFLEFIPHFAKQYSVKQRFIWAYKILFLDVLFPMDLNNVFFVDADQVHGAPYGDAPMDDDSEDMEGFRFWKTGYWEHFLRGAVYVVDLVRFRQMAAGDILHLPNDLQGHVPIVGFMSCWLISGKDRLGCAKTIDLRQNPLTIQPKLACTRQIPERGLYDGEIARFTRKLADEGRIHASAAAADVNELSKAGHWHGAAAPEKVE